MITDNTIGQEVFNKSNVDVYYKRLVEMIRECALQCMPRGNNRKYKPFWNHKLGTLKAERDEARKSAEKSKSLQDSQELRRKQAVLKRAVLDAKKAWYRNFVTHLDYKRDGQRAFKYLATLNNEETRELNEPLITVSGREVVNNIGKARVLSKHYASVSRLPKKYKNYRTEPTIGCPSFEEYLLFHSPFSAQELRRAETEMKKGKCAGPDDIPLELLTNLGDKAKIALLTLYNYVWIKEIPSDWRKAEIIPLLKKDKCPSKPDSYRPISLTSACCKLMERMIANRLNSFLEINHKITDFQAGFRKRRGTVEQVAYLTQWIKDGFHRKQSTIAVFIDFKAAYDTIWKSKLLEKLITCGIRGSMLRWFNSFLAQRFARVNYRGARSKYVQLKNGLPQGAVVSCTLFNIMINDLLDKINEVKGVQSLLFADDLVIFATSSHIPAIVQSINNALHMLEKWCDVNAMTVNMKKTACQLYTMSTKSHSFQLYYKNQELIQQDTVKYLGVTLDKKLLMKKHAEEIAKNARSRLRLLRRLSSIKWGSSQDTLITTYKTFIRPVLEYGSELVSTSSEPTKKILDKVQNEALRVITGASKSTPILAMEIQTGVEPLKYRRDMSLLKLTEKCLRLPVNHWKSHVPGMGRLLTQTSVLTKASQLREEYDLKWDMREVFKNEDLSHLFLNIPPSSLSIGDHCKKSQELAPKLKLLTDEKIHSVYPKEAWLHVYTDGSANKVKEKAGAGFVCEGFFEGSVPLGTKCNNFDAEVEAIKQAAYHLGKIDSEVKRVVFFIDSQAAILALTSGGICSSSRVAETKQAISSLVDLGWYIVYQWVPSHCNVKGNELADLAAKKACNFPQPKEPVTFEQCKLEVKAKVSERILKDQFENSRGKAWESLMREKVPSSLPRRDFTANFRLITRHDYLQAHLCRIGIKDTKICPLCCTGEEMNIDHLPICPKLITLNLMDNTTNLWRQNSILYWASRNEMGLMSQI